MTKFLKVAVAAAAVIASGFSITAAFASGGDMPSCLSSSFTTHGVWYWRLVLNILQRRRPPVAAAAVAVWPS